MIRFIQIKITKNRFHMLRLNLVEEKSFQLEVQSESRWNNTLLY